MTIMTKFGFSTSFFRQKMKLIFLKNNFHWIMRNLLLTFFDSLRRAWLAHGLLALGQCWVSIRGFLRKMSYKYDG